MNAIPDELAWLDSGRVVFGIDTTKPMHSSQVVPLIKRLQSLTSEMRRAEKRANRKRAKE